MVVNLRDFYLPLLFISIILGYQVLFYFSRLYLRVRKEKLVLNKALLAYALTFGFALTGYSARIINIYFIKESNVLIFGIIIKITFILLFLALISYITITSLKDFRKIINTKYNKIFLPFFSIPLIFVIIFDVDNAIFMLTAFFTLILAFSYIFFIHFKLIKFSTGDVKKRLYLIIFGFILCTVQLFIGGYIPAYILLKDYSDILQLIAAPIFITGLLIIFLGIYEFPAFLEFEWKENLLGFYIIDKRNYNMIYKYIFNFEEDNHYSNLKDSSNNKKTEMLISRGIIGIDEVISFITKTGNDKIEKIHQGDFLVLLDYGENSISFIIFCLLVKKEMNSSSYFLNRIKNEFIQLYKTILLNIDVIEDDISELFISFNDIINNAIK